MYEAIEEFGIILWQMRVWIIMIFGMAIAGTISRLIRKRSK